MSLSLLLSIVTIESYFLQPVIKHSKNHYDEIVGTSLNASETHMFILFFLGMTLDISISAC